MRILKAQLLNLRIGTGATRLPPNIKKLTLAFNYKSNDGHLGARKFWRECLPRLKYHNPDVDMEVVRRMLDSSRKEGNDGGEAVDGSTSTSNSKEATPATLSIFYDKDTTPQTLDVRYKYPEDIMSELIKLTSATPIIPTAEELALAEDAKYVFEKRARQLELKLGNRRKRKANYKVKHPQSIASPEIAIS